MKFPPETDCRLGLIPGGREYYVFLAAPPLKAGVELLDVARRPGSLTVTLTHDAGCAWTDRKGERFAESFLANGGAVIMQFATLQDALAAHARAKREMRQVDSDR